MKRCRRRQGYGVPGNRESERNYFRRSIGDSAADHVSTASLQLQPNCSNAKSDLEITRVPIDDCRKCEGQIPNVANSFEFLTWYHGLGCGVGRGLAVGVALGIAVGVTLGVGLAVAVGVAVGVGVGLPWQPRNQFPH